MIIPIRIESEANRREHWAKKAKRVKNQREAAYWYLKVDRTGFFLDSGLVVKLTRIAPRDLDTDNLAGGFKAVRDGIADYFGINDNDPRVRWEYAQERGEPKQYTVRVELR